LFIAQPLPLALDAHPAIDPRITSSTKRPPLPARLQAARLRP
jgi:hypothetical protein